MSNSQLGRGLYITTAVIIAAVPFHAFLTVWLSSAVGHYTALRLWKEFLLVGLAAVVLVLYVRDETLRQRLQEQRLVRWLGLLIAAYILLHLFLGVIALARDDVTAKALGYGFISNLRYVVFFVVAMIGGYYAAAQFKASWQRLLLWPAAGVVVLGLLQLLVLPADVLRHFGYNAVTISPFTAVDQKVEYARVQSTLRGPNPLGAYLVMILTALAALFIKKRQKATAGLLLAALAVLYGTYSRSAELGVIMALFTAGYILANAKARRLLLVGGAAAILVTTGSVVALRNDDTVQNVFFHTDETSRSPKSSNQSRAQAMEDGLRDVAHHPLGSGPGTAGPASVYNNGRTRLAENYFIQIGQEVGVLGTLLFAAICGLTGWLLWQIRNQGVLPVILLASLAGLTVVNLLSHAWADDTLAYIWWGLAGLTIGAYMLADNMKRKKHAKTSV